MRIIYEYGNEQIVFGTVGYWFQKLSLGNIVPQCLHIFFSKNLYKLLTAVAWFCFCRDASLKERQTGENIVFRPQNVSGN